MSRLLASTLSALILFVTGAAFASDEYKSVPAGDLQYAQCIANSLKKWEGGEASSPIAGQNKAEAFCTCLWQETDEDFKGDLAKFSETSKGKAVNKTCEKYSNWGD